MFVWLAAGCVDVEGGSPRPDNTIERLLIGQWEQHDAEGRLMSREQFAPGGLWSYTNAINGQRRVGTFAVVEGQVQRTMSHKSQRVVELSDTFVSEDILARVYRPVGPTEGVVGTWHSRFQVVTDQSQDQPVLWIDATMEFARGGLAERRTSIGVQGINSVDDDSKGSWYLVGSDLTFEAASNLQRFVTLDGLVLGDVHRRCQANCED